MPHSTGVRSLLKLPKKSVLVLPLRCCQVDTSARLSPVTNLLQRRDCLTLKICVIRHWTDDIKHWIELPVAECVRTAQDRTAWCAKVSLALALDPQQ